MFIVAATAVPKMEHEVTRGNKQLAAAGSRRHSAHVCPLCVAHV